MSLLLLLCTVAVGADDIHAVPSGASASIQGPAVWMTEGRYRAYVADSRNLPSCLLALDGATGEIVKANERVVKVRGIAEVGLSRNEDLVAQQVQTISDISVSLAEERERNGRLRMQRNVAWGIAGGFLAASTAAVVLSLN